MVINAPIEPGLQADQRLVDRAWLRIGAGLAVAAQAMVFSLAVSITPAEGAGYWVAHGGLMASAWIVLVLLGCDLVGEAWAAARAGRVSIDLLFLVTLLGALAGSMICSFTGTGAVYYEVVAILIVIHTAGKMLGARSRLAALRAVDRTRELFDRCVVRGSEGEEREVAVRDLRGGETVVVGVGRAICVDGVIGAGRALVQETSITGEWAPVAKGPGDAVWAGSQAVDGALEVKVKEGPRRLDGVLATVEAARVAPSQLQAQADRLMAFFLPLVVGTSAGTWWFWSGRVEWSEALFNAMAVLLVACPCAMGLATPVAVWGGLARLARGGLVARTGDFLDVLARVDVMCFDKTGTLSTAVLTVQAWENESAWREPVRASWLAAAVRAVEGPWQHPIAAALRQAESNPIGYFKLRATEVGVVAGAGVTGVVEGRRVAVGEWALTGWEGAAPVGTGKTIFVAVDGELAATITLGETWREGMGGVLGELGAMGIACEVLTGDAHPPGDLGVPVRGGLTPAAKTARIQELVTAGRTVVLVGDGVNDAAAMTTAAAGIALGEGSDLARAAAMAVLAGDDLRGLPGAIRLARAVRRGVRGNLWFALSYNVAGMALAAAGWLHPVVAALLMLGSSTAVAVRALRSAGELRVGSAATAQA